MKKFVAVLLALVLVLTLSVSLAETRQFVMVAVIDFDGNAADLESNPDAFPVLVLVMDDAAMTCAFGTEDAMIDGSIEVTGTEDRVAFLTATLADGTEVAMEYHADEQAVYVIDEENSFVYILQNIEYLAE